MWNYSKLVCMWTHGGREGIKLTCDAVERGCWHIIAQWKLLLLCLNKTLLLKVGTIMVLQVRIRSRLARSICYVFTFGKLFAFSHVAGALHLNWLVRLATTKKFMEINYCLRLLFTSCDKQTSVFFIYQNLVPDIMMCNGNIKMHVLLFLLVERFTADMFRFTVWPWM